MKSTFSQITTGINSLAGSFAHLRSKRLTWVLLLPFLINSAILVLGWWVVGDLSDRSLAGIQWVLEYLGLFQESDGWFMTSIYVTIWIILRILYFILFAYVGGYVVLVFLSPVLSWMATKLVDKELRSAQSNSFSGLLNGIMRGVVLATRNLFIELLVFILLFGLSFIPVVGVVSPLLMFLVSAYYFGFSVLDYAFEVRGITMTESIQLMRRNRFLTTSLGSPMAFILLIPFIGVFFSGFVAILCTSAACLSLNNQNKEPR